MLITHKNTRRGSAGLRYLAGDHQHTLSTLFRNKYMPTEPRTQALAIEGAVDFFIKYVVLHAHRVVVNGYGGHHPTTGRAADGVHTFLVTRQRHTDQRAGAKYNDKKSPKVFHILQFKVTDHCPPAWHGSCASTCTPQGFCSS